MKQDEILEVIKLVVDNMDAVNIGDIYFINDILCFFKRKFELTQNAQNRLKYIKIKINEYNRK